ncbi:MAG: hypothetical protein VX278_19290 [Myxococcota bacterium]|nr:hypothetical protein [Myxococcota bacterium]
MSSLLVLVLTVSVLAIPGLLIVMLMRLFRGVKRVGEILDEWWGTVYRKGALGYRWLSDYELLDEKTKQ